MISVLKKKGVVVAGLVIFLLAGLVSLYNFWILQDFTIIYTNDIHGRIGPSKRLVSQESDSAEEIGGFGSLATYLEREDVPDDYNLLDAGDFFHGTLEGERDYGEPVVKLMDELSCRAATIGNHDFHDGTAFLPQLAAAAGFPLLGANVLDADTGRVVEGAEPNVVLECDGTKVGIVGITVPQYGMEGVEFAPIVSTAKEQVKLLQEEGAGLIILLTHLGLNPSDPESSPDYRLAKEVEGVDLIVGGHYHAIIDPPYVEPDSGTLVCQAGCHLTHVGRLDLKYNRITGRIAGYRNTITPLWLKDYPEDGRIAEMVAGDIRETGEEANEVLGYARGNISGSWEVAAMGDLAADLMREEARVDVAFINKSGVRDGIYRGEITRRDIYRVLPFSNELVCFDLSGEQLKNIMEEDASERGERLYFSGLTATYDMKKKPGERATDIKIDGVPMRDGATYRVCTIDFLKDALPVLRGLHSVKNTGIKVRDLLERHVKDNYYVQALSKERGIRELY